VIMAVVQDVKSGASTFPRSDIARFRVIELDGQDLTP